MLSCRAPKLMHVWCLTQVSIFSIAWACCAVDNGITIDARYEHHKATQRRIATSYLQTLMPIWALCVPALLRSLPDVLASAHVSHHDDGDQEQPQALASVHPVCAG